ncbi:hypothetical protein ABH991_007275 [Bradyrhizobium ottawaense]|uniref:Uncharacterized protein n=1 Tax=Bradyrhizobium ottawaense TaxID=931866 RepID=A0ABV4FXN8_9BRAD
MRKSSNCRPPRSCGWSHRGSLPRPHHSPTGSSDFGIWDERAGMDGDPVEPFLQLCFLHQDLRHVPAKRTSGRGLARTLASFRKQLHTTEREQTPPNLAGVRGHRLLYPGRLHLVQIKRAHAAPRLCIDCLTIIVALPPHRNILRLAIRNARRSFDDQACGPHAGHNVLRLQPARLFELRIPSGDATAVILTILHSISRRLPASRRPQGPRFPFLNSALARTRTNQFNREFWHNPKGSARKPT